MDRDPLNSVRVPSTRHPHRLHNTNTISDLNTTFNTAP
jgi:hypothetical protein